MKRAMALITVGVLAIALAVPTAAVASGHGLNTTLVPRTVATFPTGYEFNSFAESLAVAPNGDLYATVTIWQEETSNIGKLYRIGHDGTMTQVGPDLAVGILSGLAFDDRGNLYAGVIAYGPLDEPAGVLRFAPDGTVTRAVTLPEWTFPNGLAFHGNHLYIADSWWGVIWRADAQSMPVTLTDPWLQDPTLAVVDENAWEGVNGLAFNGNTLFAVNAGAGSVVRIPIDAHGAPGTPSLFVEPDPDLVGADGVAFDEDGGLWIAANNANVLKSGTLARVDRNGVVSILAKDTDWLDYPAQPAFGTAGRTRSTLYLVNGALNTGDCNVISFDVGVRGRLLP